MATASAVARKAAWHERGSWSAREDRVPSAVWLGILWAGMLAGFGLDFSRFLHESPPAPFVVRIHAVVFSSWMLILTAQVLLVLGNRVAWHRKMGWVAVGWACLMAVFGPWAAIAFQVANLGGPIGDPPFLSVQLLNTVNFVALLARGLTLRKNPAAHRRMMILATVALADPGFSRFSGWLWPNEPSNIAVWFIYVFYGNVLLVALMTAWDWWRGRLMRSFVLGAAGLLATEFVASLLYFWGPWKTLSAGWVKAWAKI
jgi:hypothetical protein